LSTVSQDDALLSVGMGAAGQRARNAMVDAAERLMAERGIEAVPLRDVLEAAGQRNKSAAHYHFGSREGLIRGIIETRMAPIDDTRRELLAKATEANRSPSTDELVRALVEPLADATVRHRHSFYGRFLARSYAEPVWAKAVEESAFGGAFRHWQQLLDDHLAAIPDPLRRPRIDRAVTTAILGIAGLEARRLPAHRREARIADLTDCITAGLDAPVAQRTHDLLRERSTALSTADVAQDATRSHAQQRPKS
jgi:AcrR family transcriptional regulator